MSFLSRRSPQAAPTAVAALLSRLTVAAARAVTLVVAVAGSLAAGWTVATLAHLARWDGSATNATVAVSGLLTLTLLLWAGRKLLLPQDPALTVMGSARWATPREIAALARTAASGLLVGREDQSGGRLLRDDTPAHLLTLAPTRAGKGVGAVIPNLLLADRSILCIDPKGENARVTADARRCYGPVHVLDPFGVSGWPASRYDPLVGLGADSFDLPDEVATLAEALVADPPGQTGEAHWNEEAKALIAGLLLRVVATEPPATRRLTTLRQLLTLPPQKFIGLLEAMQAEETLAGGLVARAANRQLGKADREAAGVLSSAQRHTHFLDSPRLAQAMDGADFSFADLRRESTTVYLVLPPDRLDAYGRWLRLLVSQALGELGRQHSPPPSPAAPPKTCLPVLFLLDEFAALGRLEAVERAMGLMAGLGVQLWPMLQDLHQLRALYGQRAETFLANAGVIQVFGTNDVETATWLSRTLGSRTARYETFGTSSSSSS